MILNFLWWFVVSMFFMFWFFQYINTFGYDSFTSQTQRLVLSFCAALLYTLVLISVIGIFERCFKVLL